MTKSEIILDSNFPNPCQVQKKVECHWALNTGLQIAPDGGWMPISTCLTFIWFANLVQIQGMPGVLLLLIGTV